jgi:hypothetical protein
MQSAISNYEESGESRRIKDRRGDDIWRTWRKTTTDDKGAGRSYLEDSDNHQEKRPKVAASRQEVSARKNIK